MSIKLNSGHSMPLVGFGCWQLDTKIAASQIYNAIKVGYRLFDLAADYGNDKQIGEGINKAIKDGLVKREELFITSKLWNTYHHPKNVGPALQKVLDDLQLDYIDLFLIHFPIALKFVPFEVKYPANLYKGDSDRLQFEDVTVAQTWGALEEEVKLGKTKSIGISNFNGALIFDLLKAAKIKPAVLQIEHHPYLQQPKLIEYVQSQDIAVTAYSSFGPQSYQAAEAHAPTLFEHKTIKSIGEKHKKTAAQVLLRWATQRSIAVIPKSNNPDRLKLNLEVNDFDLTKEEIDQISKLDIGFRFNDPWDWDEKSRIPIFV